MKNVFKITLIILVISISLISCTKKGTPGMKMGNESKEKEVIVMVQEMKLQNLKKFVKISGKLEGITDVDLTCETNGQVIEVSKNLGDWVNEGESIGSVDNADAKNQLLQAQAALMATEANLETANLNMKASQSLYDKNIISESEFLQVKSANKNSQAAYNGSLAGVESARKNLENSQFTSPVSGYIAELNLQVGETVNPGMKIVGIVNPTKLKIKSGISESDISYVKKGDRVIIKYHGKEYEGKISGVGIRPVTGGNNYPVEIVMENPKLELLPGMVIEGHIYSHTFENVLYTSIENLREKYDKEFVYVINSKNRAEIRIVTLGKKISNNVIILSGLKVGDRLVIDGIDSLSDGTLVEVKSGFDLN